MMAVREIKPQVFRDGPAGRRIRAKVMHVISYPMNGSEHPHQVIPSGATLSASVTTKIVAISSIKAELPRESG